MRKYDFVVAYDISDPKRLRKIAKVLEKKAIRFQYSLFLVTDVTRDEVMSLVDRILSIYNEKQDDIRIYRIKHYGIRMGSAMDLAHPYDFF